MGRVDVDEMLDEMTPEEFDGWLSYWLVEPFGEPWQQTALLAATMHNAGVMATAPYRTKDLQDSDFKRPADFMPNGPEHVEQKERPNNIDAFEAWAARRYGDSR